MKALEPYRLKFKVRDYECDMQGIVNNSVYQNYLEQEWLKELRKNHTVKINKEALYSIGK